MPSAPQLPLTLSLHLPSNPQTQWFPCNDCWNGSFCLIDTVWTLWHVSIRDHSFYSNDCFCGSQSLLMTSATFEESCLLLPVVLCPSICQQRSGEYFKTHTDIQQCLLLWMHWFILFNRTKKAHSQASGWMSVTVT